MKLTDIRTDAVVALGIFLFQSFVLAYLFGRLFQVGNRRSTNENSIAAPDSQCYKKRRKKREGSGLFPITGLGGPTAFVCLLILIIAFVSLMPLSAKNAIGTTGSWHWTGHVVAFGALTFAIGLLLRGIWAPLNAGALNLVLAFSLESLQSALYGNDFEWYDITTDAIGIGCGMGGLLAARLFQQMQIRFRMPRE